VPGEVVNATTSNSAWPWMATEAAADGSWAITYNLPPPSSNGPPFILTVTGSLSNTSLVFEDVRWGDVWMCVGDSSMLLPVSESLGGTSWLASSPVSALLSNGAVRLLPVAAVSASTPQPDFGDGECTWSSGSPLLCNVWQNATLQTAAAFSALCLQTALELVTTAGNPGNGVVGLLQVRI
jgi:sialate O-acetylesterase